MTCGPIAYEPCNALSTTLQVPSEPPARCPARTLFLRHTVCVLGTVFRPLLGGGEHHTPPPPTVPLPVVVTVSSPSSVFYCRFIA